MQKVTLLFFLLSTTVLSSSLIKGQSIVNGGSGQGLLAGVPENRSFGYSPNFKHIQPESSLGFWRVEVTPTRLSAALQELQVSFVFNVDVPHTVKGNNLSGGEELYKVANFQAKISGRIQYTLRGNYENPVSGKQFSFEQKLYSELGKSVTKGSLFTWGPEIVDAMGKLKISSEPEPMAAFMSKFKVQITSIVAVNRVYSGFEKLDGEVGALLAAGKKESSYQALLADARNAENAGNTDNALQKYEDAYKVRQEADVKGKIATLKIKKEETASSPSSSSDSSAAKGSSVTAAKKSSDTQKKEEEKKSKNEPYVDRSARNRVLEQTGSNNIYGNKNQHNDALVQQGYAINQQSKVTEQGIYNAAKGINNIFDQNIARLNREADAKSAALDRELEARKRAREAEKRQNARKEQEWKERQLQLKEQSRQQRESRYKAKGGAANYSARLNQWKLYATKVFQQVITYLKNNKGQLLSFSSPAENCQYIEAIEKIQHSGMPNSHKDILIRNVLNVRHEYHKLFLENAFVYDDWKSGHDDLYWQAQSAACGNYLDFIAATLSNSHTDIYGMDQELFITNKYDNRIMADGNYSLPVGKFPARKKFTSAVSSAAITTYTETLSENNDVWKTFPERPWDWSRGFFKERGKSYSGPAYYSILLTDNQPLLQREADKFRTFHRIKESFFLNSATDELKMSFFNYHTGHYPEAYQHFQRYWFLVPDLLTAISSNEIPGWSNRQTIEAGLLGAVLYLERGEYEIAEKFLAAISEASIKKSSTTNGKPAAVNPTVSRAVKKLQNQIYFRTGAYNKMTLPANEGAVKEARKFASKLFQYVPDRVSTGSSRKSDIEHNNQMRTEWLPAIRRQYDEFPDPHFQALALIQLGNKKLAAAVFADMYAYYSKTDKKNPRVFTGTQTDIDAFKEAVKALYPKNKKSFSFELSSGYDLFERTFWTNNAYSSWKTYLKKTTMQLTAPMNNTPVDLGKEPYKKQLEDLAKTVSDRMEGKDAIEQYAAFQKELFRKLETIYNSGKLLYNSAAKTFLSDYIRCGIQIGKFREAATALMEYEQHFTDAANPLILEKHLVKVMLPQKDIEINKKIRDSKTRAYKPRPAKVYFENTIRGGDMLTSTDKTKLNDYLNLWSRHQISSPMIPYLISLYD